MNWADQWQLYIEDNIMKWETLAGKPSVVLFWKEKGGGEKVY